MSSPYLLLGGEDSLWASPERVRKGFISKVYGILSLQLVATALIASPFVLVDHAKVQHFISTSMWLLWFSLVVSLSTILVYACIPRLMREFPINYLLLALFTVAEGISVGFVSSLYSTASVVIALGLVTTVTLFLSIFAAKTTIDFTKALWPYLIALSVVMIGAGLFLLIFPSQVGITVYSVMGAMLFSVYIVFDTQMILGGKNEIYFSVDDYVPAAISLYVDIVSLFIYFLQLFGQRRTD